MIMLNKAYQQNRGYTLVELLIYIGLFTILIGILTTTFFSTLELKARTEIMSAVEHDSRYIPQKLVEIIRAADSVISPLTNGETSSQLIVSRNGETETYQIQNGNLVQTINGVSTQLNSEGTTLTHFSFLRLGNVGGLTNLRLSLTLTSEGQIAGESQTNTVTTSVGTR